MVDEITTDELKNRIESDGDIQVLDIREEHEIKNGYVEGAIHVPMSRLTLELGEYDWTEEIYVICRHGNSSIQASRLLMAYEGVSDDATVASVAGGYQDWEYELVEGESKTEPTKAAA
ncbi:MAG: rhodanese-like domain-containing protein [Halobacteria archaeon]